MGTSRCDKVHPERENCAIIVSGKCVLREVGKNAWGPRPRASPQLLFLLFAQLAYIGECPLQAATMVRSTLPMKYSRRGRICGRFWVLKHFLSLSPLKGARSPGESNGTDILGKSVRFRGPFVSFVSGSAFPLLCCCERHGHTRCLRTST